MHVEPQKTRNEQSNFEKGEEAAAITLPDIRLSHKAVPLKTVWHWHETHTSMGHTWEPKANPPIYGPLSRGRAAKDAQRGKGKSPECCWEPGPISEPNTKFTWKRFKN